MSIIVASVLFILGLIIIIKGGDWFVEAAVWIAKATGVPTILIGATIVSVATTLPELLVSMIATNQQLYGVVMGNVVGSLLCNMGLAMGLTAFFAPVVINKSNFTIKSSFMLFSTGIIFVMGRDLLISKQEGIILLLLFLVYIVMNIWEFKKGESDNKDKGRIKYDKSNAKTYIFKFIVGAAFISIGARLLVTHGVTIAIYLGVPEQVVSLTLIAIGTSLPEITTAITSVIKKHQGVSIGNILGANILNLLMALGVSTAISSDGLIIDIQRIAFGNFVYNIPQTLFLDLPVALVMMFILVVGGLIFGKISRTIGFVLFSIYILYLATLVELFLQY
ncbi:MAG: calcium/sodium antiporter [Clostridiales bacterium]|nr:calcium/sodium antiporter [Clostridiales bacterium]